MANQPLENRRRALLSVTDKTRLDEIGKLLHSYGYELIASGGTARFLREKDIPVTGVNELTGYPEIFGGRVKTLHPVIHGGILGPSRESFAETTELGIGPIDLVVVNLYQFREAVAAGVGEAEMVEKIDIGGPTLLRAAAKNFARVTVVSDPIHYDELLTELTAGEGDTSLCFRRRMAGSTFRLVERYNDAIAGWFEGAGEIPLRYGENPHQSASLHLPAAPDGQPPLAGLGLTQHAAVDEETAEVLAKRVLEILVAPEFTPEALARLTRKKNVRVLTMDLDRFLAGTRNRTRAWGELVLTQGEDEGFPELDEWNVAAGDEPDAATRTALEMVWKVCKHGKSNAIVLGNMTATLGMGFGQMSRVDSTELAVLKAGNQGLDLQGCVAGSDGFFPFPDGIEKLAAAGARAVIAPGGSIRDDEVAEAAGKLGITLILTNRRHFNH